MEFFKQRCARQPKKVLWVKSETNTFASNRLDTAKCNCRGLVYIPKMEWYCTEEEINRLANSEDLLDNQDEQTSQFIIALLKKIGQRFDNFK